MKRSFGVLLSSAVVLRSGLTFLIGRAIVTSTVPPSATFPNQHRWQRPPDVGRSDPSGPLFNRCRK